MTPTTARAITAVLVGIGLAAIGIGLAAVGLVAAALITDEPAPTTTTVTTTVTTPVAPCDGPACPPWPSLDY